MDTRYYSQLDDTYFSEISDDALAQIMQAVSSMNDASESESEKIPPPPVLLEASFAEALRYSVVDVSLLCIFALAFTAMAFLKFFRSDI